MNLLNCNGFLLYTLANLPQWNPGILGDEANGGFESRDRNKAGAGARGKGRQERGERREERRGQGEWTCVCCWSCQESLFWWTLQVNYCVVCQSFLIPSTYWHPFRLDIAYFSPALLGQRGYHGDSVTAVGLDAVWASNYDSCLSHCYYGFWQVLLLQFCPSF